MNPDVETAPAPDAGTTSPSSEGPLLVVPPDRIPDVSNIVIRDDTPVESIYAEKQYRLFTEPLYSSWPGPKPGVPFLALANVGLFFKYKEPPLVPDMMLSLKVRVTGDPRLKENNSYFVWEFGKPPDVVIELVSDRRGGENTSKFEQYASIGISYYVIFDPDKYLSEDVLRSFAREGNSFQPLRDNWFPGIGLGVTLWESSFEDHPATWWLRWCDADGNLIPTGNERAEKEHDRAEKERDRAEKERDRAEKERDRAEKEHERAEKERQRKERLEAQLRALGIEPEPEP
jgi:Putative restriction endonuclease